MVRFYGHGHKVRLKEGPREISILMANFLILPDKRRIAARRDCPSSLGCHVSLCANNIISGNGSDESSAFHKHRRRLVAFAGLLAKGGENLQRLLTSMLDEIGVLRLEDHNHLMGIYNDELSSLFALHASPQEHRSFIE
uniref:NR LBD domain-containing protein n=1 Tax=Steinernema glaseri TaxID=37863 RepID=A0A1I7ZEX2_9BILA